MQRECHLKFVRHHSSQVRALTCANHASGQQASHQTAAPVSVELAMEALEVLAVLSTLAAKTAIPTTLPPLSKSTPTPTPTPPLQALSQSKRAQLISVR